MMRPRTNGPRSVIFTTTDWLVIRLVTRTIVPIGRVRCAAVIAFWSYTVPSAPLRPAYGGPYQLASPISIETGFPKLFDAAAGEGVVLVSGDSPILPLWFPATLAAGGGGG